MSSFVLGSKETLLPDFEDYSKVSLEDVVLSENLADKPEAEASQPSKITVTYAILAFMCLVSGVCSTMQNGVNARFGIAMMSGYYSLFLAFAVGSVVVIFARLLEVFIVVDPMLGRRPIDMLETLKCYFYVKPTAHSGHVLWTQIPSLIGIAFVLVGILITPKLGFGLVFVLQIIGGMLASCTIDHFSILGIARSRMTIVACLGIIVACVGAALTVISQIEQTPPDAETWVTVLLSILTFLSGFSFPFQGVVNSVLCDEVYPSAMVSILMTYVFGLCYAFTLALVASFVQPEQFYDIPVNIGNTEWWMWLTGFLGLGVVGVALYATPVVGAGLWYGLMFTGQLVSATIFDHYNTFSIGQYNASIMRITGVIIAVLSVFLFKSAHALTKRFFHGIDPITGNVEEDIPFRPDTISSKKENPCMIELKPIADHDFGFTKEHEFTWFV